MTEQSQCATQYTVLYKRQSQSHACQKKKGPLIEEIFLVRELWQNQGEDCLFQRLVFAAIRRELASKMGPLAVKAVSSAFCFQGVL